LSERLESRDPIDERLYLAPYGSGQARRRIRTLGRLPLSAQAYVPGMCGRHGAARESRLRAERSKDLAGGPVRLGDQADHAGEQRAG
jgi:hypothetical protein